MSGPKRFSFTDISLISLLSTFWIEGYITAIVEEKGLSDADDALSNPMVTDPDNKEQQKLRDIWVRETFERIHAMRIKRSGLVDIESDK